MNKTTPLEYQSSAAKSSSYRLLTIDDAEQLTLDESLNYFKSFYNPGLGTMMALLGLSRVRPVKAQGMMIYLSDGREILDFTGGVGVLNHGHNHPRILKARREFLTSQKMEIWKFFISPYVAALSKNLAEVFPGSLDISFYCNSGAEAVEGAIKLAFQARKNKHQNIILYMDNSFHGKTHGALSVTGLEENNSSNFTKLPGCIKLKSGDIEDLKTAFQFYRCNSRQSSVAALIIEPIHVEGVHQHSTEYLKLARQLCTEANAALIFDEVYTGFGRTGKMFAMEHAQVIPDIACFSKSFGGGKASVAGYISSRELFNSAYGGMDKALLHSTTFSGLGEEIVTALEALNITVEERLVENAEIMGKYLASKLELLKKKHTIIKETKTIGLCSMIRIESMIQKLSKKMPLTHIPEKITAKLTTAGVLTALFEKHNILTFIPPHETDCFQLTPSLILKKDHIDKFIDGLDSVLETNLVETLYKFTKRYLLQLKGIE